jgi:hypothetical protein
MVQGNILIVVLIPPYETTAKTAVVSRFAGIKLMNLSSGLSSAAQRVDRPAA